MFDIVLISMEITGIFQFLQFDDFELLSSSQHEKVAVEVDPIQQSNIQCQLWSNRFEGFDWVLRDNAVFPTTEQNILFLCLDQAKYLISVLVLECWDFPRLQLLFDDGIVFFC